MAGERNHTLWIAIGAIGTLTAGFAAIADLQRGPTHKPVADAAPISEQVAAPA
jgi:hypothetical protein